jgi:tellurite resistance protein
MQRVEAEMLWAISLASYLMARADGKLTEDEYQALGEALVSLAEEPISQEQLHGLLDQHESLLQRVGVEGAAHEMVKRLPNQDARRAALIMAATIAFVDGEVSDEEGDTFLALSVALGFSEDEAEEILEEVFSDE